MRQKSIKPIPAPRPSVKGPFIHGVQIDQETFAAQQLVQNKTAPASLLQNLPESTMPNGNSSHKIQEVSQPKPASTNNILADSSKYTDTDNNNTTKENITRTSSLQREDSITKTPSLQREESVTKTPSLQREESVTKTPSLQREESVTKTPSTPTEEIPESPDMLSSKLCNMRVKPEAYVNVDINACLNKIIKGERVDLSEGENSGNNTPENSSITGLHSEDEVDSGLSEPNEHKTVQQTVSEVKKPVVKPPRMQPRKQQRVPRAHLYEEVELPVHENLRKQSSIKSSGSSAQGEGADTDDSEHDYDNAIPPHTPSRDKKSSKGSNRSGGTEDSPSDDESDDEPLYYNLVKLREETLRRQMCNPEVIYAQPDLSRKKLVRDAQRLSQAFARREQKPPLPQSKLTLSLKSGKYLNFLIVIIFF